MTTIAQVKQVVQPLLRRNPDLGLVGRTIFLKPVHHLLRAVGIDRSSHPRAVIPTSFVMPLFNPREYIVLSFKKRIGYWLLDDAGMEEELFGAIEQKGLPVVRSIQSIDDFVHYATPENFPEKPLRALTVRIYVHIARGDLAAANEFCDYMETPKAKQWYLPDMKEQYDRITQEICPLVRAGDRAGLARLLHQWEAYTVKHLKLEKYWEPTPFPIEQSA